MSEAVDPTELTEEELEERRQSLRETVEDEAASLAASEQAALEALSEATEDETETHTVELTGGKEVEVVDSMPGRLEKKAANIQNDDVTAGVDAMAEVLAHLIQTDGYDSVEVWRLYHQQYGMANLMENAMAVTQPYYDRQEALQDQRQFRGQR